MINARTLLLPIVDLPLILETDASGFGVGVVLLRISHPIAYYNKLFGFMNKGKSHMKKSLWPQSWLFRNRDTISPENRFIIRPDQESLKYLMEQQEIDLEYQKWAYKLLRFIFQIVYKLGPSGRGSRCFIKGICRQYGIWLSGKILVNKST